MSQIYDPVLAVWQRRRARDTFVGVHEKNTADTAGLRTALDESRERIAALEGLIAQFATAGKQETA